MLARAAGFKWHEGGRAGSVGYQPELSPTIQADKQPAVLGFCPGVSRTGTLTATEGLAPTLRTGAGTTLSAVAFAIPSGAIGARDGGTNARMAVEQLSPTLKADGKAHAVAFAQNTRDEVRLIGGDGQVAGCLSASEGMKQRTYVCTQYGGEPAGTLTARADSSPCADRGQNVVTDGWVVRRLTPLECERLQGFPDGWTDVPYKGKDHPPDTPRYRAIGNSMAVPVMMWIGERIARSEAGNEQ